VLFAKKLKNNDVLILENFEIAQPKTKEIAVLIKKLDLIGKKVLIITYKKDDKFYRAGRNIRNLKILQSKDVNGYEFLVNDKILFSKESIQDILRRIN